MSKDEEMKFNDKIPRDFKFGRWEEEEEPEKNKGVSKKVDAILEECSLGS